MTKEALIKWYDSGAENRDEFITLVEQALAQQEPSGPATPEDMKIYKDIADGYRRDVAQQRSDPWQTAVIDQLVIHHIYQAIHDTDPRKAVHDLLCISNDIALDPQVSSDAQALVDRGRGEVQQEQPAQKVVAWEGAEDWEPLAWHLCAEENGEEACSELIWEGGAIPEPWGDRWLKYEHEAKRMIATVKKFAPPTQPAQEQPAQKPDLWKTQFLTDVMTSAGLLMYGRTDKKLAQRIADGSARWRTELYTHPAPAQPAMTYSDLEACREVADKAFCHHKSSIRGQQLCDADDYEWHLAKAIEAHCRGGADK